MSGEIYVSGLVTCNEIKVVDMIYPSANSIIRCTKEGVACRSIEMVVDMVQATTEETRSWILPRLRA